jgi:hypothetical protein
MSFDKREPLADIAKQNEPDVLSFEAMQNLVGFFSLLLEIDRRSNPERYRSE